MAGPPPRHVRTARPPRRVAGGAQPTVAARPRAPTAERARVHQAAGDRDDLSQLTVGYPSFRIEAANRAMCLMSGFDRDELAGQDVAMLFPVNQLADRAAVE